MDRLSPVGPIYQAGTLSGNPLAMAAGLTALRKIRDDENLFERLEASGRRLAEGTAKNLTDLGLDHTTTQVGSMGSIFFTSRVVANYMDARTCDTERYGRYFHEMLKRGIYLAPSQFEAFFISSRHTDAEIDRTLEAQREALSVLQEQPQAARG